MSFRIAYTDRDTLMIACGDIVTEVPLTPPSGSSGAAQASPPKPAPAPAPAGGGKPFKISAPKHGPRTMLIMPGMINIQDLPGYQIVKRAPRIVKQQELEQLRADLATELPGKVRLIPDLTVLGDPIISCTISRNAMTNGFSTETIEKLFKRHELSGLVALKVDFDSEDG